MEELPIDMREHISEYLDCKSLAALSRCSKRLNQISCTHLFWKKRFDLFFSTDFMDIESVVDWRSEFRKQFTLRKWKKYPHQDLLKGSPTAILSRNSCGKIVDIIEQIPNYPKCKIHIYEIQIEKRENSETPFKHVVPTDKFTIFPSNNLMRF